MLFFFKTVVRWRRFIILSGLLTAALVAGISLFLPKWYTATTSIFPPEKKSNISMYAELLQNVSMPIIGATATGVRPETIYIDMLKSRAVCEQIIEEFNFYEVYKVGMVEDALHALHSHLSFTLSENGLLIFSFEDQDPQRSAAVANRFIELLDEFNTGLNVSRASKTKEFVENQLEQRKLTLAAAESALKQFQESRRALDLDEQLRAAMTIVAELTGQAIALETELEILSHYTAATSEEYTRKKREYDETLSQLAKLKLDRNQDDDDLVRAYLPALGTIPEIALELLRLKRKVEIENTIYTMLVKEFEKSRIEEARDTPTLQVLDRASVPNLRSRPKRKMLVILSAMLGVGWSTFLAVFVTLWRENKEGSRVFTDVLSPIAADFSKIFRRK